MFNVDNDIDGLPDGLPDEIPALGVAGRVAGELIIPHLRKDDRIIAYGRIIKIVSDFWKEPMYQINFDHLFNETIKYGY